MNAVSPIEHETLVNMTSKGQVLIPKELRDRHGLRPGEPVRVGENDRGETVILPTSGKHDETPEEREARVRAALKAIRGKYPNPDGMTTDQFMLWLRGDHQP